MFPLHIICFSERESPPFLQNLVSEFKDPQNRNRECVAALIDCTYIDIKKSSDLELQKLTWYPPKVIKKTFTLAETAFSHDSTSMK